MYQKTTALITGATANFGGDLLQLAFAIALFILGVIVALQGLHKLGQKTPEQAQTTEAA